MDVSVVVPTYNRREQVLALLERLAQQTLERGRFEVVLVSDGSTDGTLEAARAAALRLGLELNAAETGHGGPGHARNVGIGLARGEFVAFTDDDVRPEPQWLAAGLAGFAAPGVAGVEGRTEPETGPLSLYRFNIENRQGGRYPTCNIFYRRAVLSQLAGFDESFRRAREDSDLAFRVLAGGQAIAFAPEAVVHHRSHHTSVTTPLAIASTLPDSVRLWRKHPGVDRLRPRFYFSDAVKMALAILALALLAAAHPWLALVPLAAFAALTLRTIVAEVFLDRVRPRWRLLPLAFVYAALPFANTYYLFKGWILALTGGASTRPW